MVDFDSLYENAIQSSIELRRGLETTLAAAKDKVTPGFVKRMKNKKIYDKSVSATER